MGICAPRVQSVIQLEVLNACRESQLRRCWKVPPTRRTSFTLLAQRPPRMCWPVGGGSRRSSGLPSPDFVSGSHWRLGPANDSLRSAWRVSPGGGGGEGGGGGGGRRSAQRPHRANFTLDYLFRRRCLDSEPARAAKHELWRGVNKKKRRLASLVAPVCLILVRAFSPAVGCFSYFFLGRHVRVNNPLLAALGPLSTPRLIKRYGGALKLPAGFSVLVHFISLYKGTVQVSNVKRNCRHARVSPKASFHL